MLNISLALLLCALATPFALFVEPSSKGFRKRYYKIFILFLLLYFFIFRFFKIISNFLLIVLAPRVSNGNILQINIFLQIYTGAILSLQSTNFVVHSAYNPNPMVNWRAFNLPATTKKFNGGDGCINLFNRRLCRKFTNCLP